MKFKLLYPLGNDPEGPSIRYGKPRPNIFLALTVLMLSLLHVVFGADIVIGGLFDTSDGSQEAALRYAVDAVNNNRHLLTHTRLSAQIEDIPQNNSFMASRKACSLLQTGVAAILGPQSGQTSAQVQSICDAFEIPHLENRWDDRLSRDDYSVNLYPHPSSLAQAYVDVLKMLGWKKFCIIYKNSNDILRVQDLLKDQSFDVMLKQLPDSDDYRPMLREVKKSGMTHVVLDVQRDNIFTVLKQAQQVGMMDAYYNYFVTSLDLQTVELEDFRHGGTNIAALRIVDPENPLVQRVSTNLQTEVALVYDAVQLFAKALDNHDRSQRVDVTPLDCDGDTTWDYGSSLINHMKMVRLNGLTGLVKFDAKGFRSDVALDIVQLTKDGLFKVGEWALANGANYTKTHKEVQKGIIDDNLRNKTLIVSSILGAPYIILKESLEPLTGNDRYEGFCVDLVDEISRILGFKYIIKVVDDGQHGKYDPNRKQWNGMIGELVDQEADLAIGDLTITHEREQVVDFTLPWMNLGITILYRKPTVHPPSVFNFLQPFSLEVWLLIATAYSVVSLLLFLLARLTPYETTNTIPCRGRKDDIPEDDHLSCLNSMWFLMASIFRQFTDRQPKAVSTRIVAGMWWFFTLIMVSSYTATLAAFLTVERMESPIQSVEDLAKQTRIKYGSLNGGSTYNFFKNSKVAIYQRMFGFMESQDPSVYTNSNEEGVNRVQESYGQYAYMMESSSVDYIVERHCDLAQVGGLLDSKSYGIALPKGSPYTQAISEAILKLREDSIVHHLRTRWWKQKRGGGRCAYYDPSRKSSEAIVELGLHNVGGVFVVLMAGMGLAIAVAVGEFVWKKRKLIRETNRV